MNRWLFLSILASSILSGCTVPPVQKVEAQAPLEISVGTQTKPIEFRKILTKIPLGEQVVKMHYGWGCFPGANIGWRGGRLNITDEELTETFRSELQSRNYQVVGDPYALFDDPSVWQAEILVAGVVTKVDTQVCFPFSGSPSAGIGNTSALKGGAFMRVTWQIYGRAAGKVVHEVTTEGSYQSEEVISGGFPIFFRNAFAANVRNLLADRGFHDLVVKHNDQQAEPPHQRNGAQGI
ncbi:MAG: hypothetical protein LBP94_04200 [Zoogloeaceae bacterium]|jgi:hypothetical protein|nr:hypothetical protein [Zoogloeaceae bacterium]